MPENQVLVERHANDVIHETRLRYVRDSVVGLVVLAVLCSLGFVFWDKQNDQNDFLRVSRANAAAIGRLTDEVADLQGQLITAKSDLEAGRSVEQLADQCVDFASASLDAAVGDLLVSLAQNPAGTPDRVVILQAAVSEVDEAKNFLFQVLDNRPLDCPPPVAVLP